MRAPGRKRQECVSESGGLLIVLRFRHAQSSPVLVLAYLNFLRSPGVSHGPTQPPLGADHSPLSLTYLDEPIGYDINLLSTAFAPFMLMVWDSQHRYCLRCNTRNDNITHHHARAATHRVNNEPRRNCR